MDDLTDRARCSERASRGSGAHLETKLHLSKPSCKGTRDSDKAPEMLGRALRFHNAFKIPHVTPIANPTFRNYATKAKAPQPKPTPRSNIFQYAIDLGPLGWLRWTAATFLTAHIFTAYFYSVNETYGISMLPTINSYGDHAIISKYYRRGRGVHVGDLVSYDHPVDEGSRAIKRVIGMEGDFVDMRPGAMIQVPQGHCWVVGDNLKHSRDSRLFGPLPLALINGKVVAKWTPWLDVRRMKNGLLDADEETSVD